MSNRLLRPRYPRLDKGHPLARYCVGAWFFGDGLDFVKDASGCNFHGTYTGVIANPFIRATSPYSSAILSDSATSDSRYDLGPINAGHPLSMSQSSGMMLSVRFKWKSGNYSWPRIIDKSSGGSAANGWALTYDGSNSGGLQFYSNGSTRLNTTQALRADDWNHVVVIIRWFAANSSPHNRIFLDGEDITSGAGGTMQSPSATTTNAALLNWNHTVSERRFVGAMDHIIVYSISIDPGVSAAWNFFTREDALALFDDPYAPFRPPSFITLISETAAPPTTNLQPDDVVIGVTAGEPPLVIDAALVAADASLALAADIATLVTDAPLLPAGAALALSVEVVTLTLPGAVLYVDEVLNDTPLGYWRLNETTPGVNFDDLQSQAGQLSFNTESTLIRGVDGITGDGDNAIGLSHPGSIPLESSTVLYSISNFSNLKTIEVIFNADTVDTLPAHVVTLYKITNDNEVQVVLFDDSGTLRLGVSPANSSTIDLQSTGAISLNTEYVVTLVQRAGVLYLYLNGALEDSLAGALLVGSSYQAVLGGYRYDDGGPRYAGTFNGIIDEFSIDTTELDESRILARHGAVPLSPPVGYIFNVSSANFALTAEQPSLGAFDQPFPIDFATLSLTAGEPPLTAASNLSVNDAAVGTSATEPGLSLEGTLAPDNAGLLLSAEVASLQQAAVLTPVDANIALTAEQPALSQDVPLVVIDTTIALSAPELVLFAQSQAEVDDAQLVLSADAAPLSSETNLSVESALLSLTAELAPLQATETLTPNDALIGLGAQEPALSIIGTLGVDNALMPLMATSPVLTTAANLAVDDANLGLIALQAFLATDIPLSVDDTNIVVSTTVVDLSGAVTINTIDAFISLDVEQAPLVIEGSLSPFDALIGVAAEQPTLAVDRDLIAHNAFINVIVTDPPPFETGVLTIEAEDAVIGLSVIDPTLFEGLDSYEPSPERIIEVID